MKHYEFKVPRRLIKKFYPHPEEYGDYVVDLVNGMYTDVYEEEDGDFITITNDTKLIMYLLEETGIGDLREVNNINAIYGGVKIVSKILNFPVPELSIIEEKHLPDKEITGLYSFSNNEILFNEDWIKRSEWIEVIITAFHEMRHAYQGFCIKTNTRESEETLRVWKEEINNYKMPSGTNKEANDQSYLEQEIEIDAIAFAHWLIKEKFDLKTVIPEFIKKEVFEKVAYFNIKNN